MSKDIFNKIMIIISMIIGVVALAFAITACCLLNNVTVEKVISDENGNMIIVYTDDSYVVIPVADGNQGEAGKSAYELYVENVPEGETPMTEVEWLESLKGVDGVNGTDGKSAYEIYVSTVPEGETPMTEAEWLESLKGADGTNGIDGVNGVDGVNGTDGKSAYEIYVSTVPEGETPMTEVEWLESLKGVDGIGIKDISLVDGVLIIMLDDNTFYTFSLTGEDTPVTPEV